MSVNEPLQLGQPAIALAQSMITEGIFPSASGSTNPSFTFGTAASIGFIITTAFDPRLVQGLTPVEGQTLAISDATVLFAVIGPTYGGQAMHNTFALPDLGSKAAQYITHSNDSNDSQPLNGAQVGTPFNEYRLENSELPRSLGGVGFDIPNQQESVGVQYLVKIYGDFPSGSAPTIDTIGMVYPFAGSLPGGTPDGFLPADGRLLDIDQYSTLYAVLGTTYGGDGRTNFALPDLRNHVPIGVGQQTIDGQTAAIFLGQRLGDAEFTLDQAQLPTQDGSSTRPISTLQPSLGMHYVINTEGNYNWIDAYETMLGQVTLYAGYRVPDDWALAQGQLLPINQYEALYSQIGTIYGGNGSTTFALPDLRGRTVVGTGGSEGLGLGYTRGSFSEYITEANLPEIVTPVPGVQVLDENGQVAGDKITGKFELDVSGVWPQARVEYSTDGTTWSETYTAQEGSNTLYVRQVNVLGQASAATQAITFVLDTTAPEAPEVVIDGVAVAAPAFKAAVPADSNDTIPRTRTGKLSFGNVEDGATLQFSIDGGQTWTDTFEAQPGLNQVQVRQVDAAGNVSPASDMIRFYWDGSDTDAAVTTTATHSTGGNAITVEQHGALATGLGTDSVDLLIHGHQQDVALPDDIEHIRLTENGLNNTVTGNAQDNVFEVIVGNWVIQGNGGQDTVKLSNALADYVITQESHDGHLQATLYGPEGRIIVRDIETIEFSDATLIKTTGTDITEIDHLYEEVLGRSPDTEGLTFWVNQMNQGATLTDVAQALSQSTEFKQLYGTPSEEQLVQELYEAILDRAPDAQGLAYWTEALVVHGATEGELIASLLTSTESQGASTTHLSTGGLFVVG